MKKLPNYSIKKESFPLFILGISFLLGLYFYARFPETVATHWGANGEVNGYASKFIGAFSLPIISVVLYLIFLIVPSIDPHQERYQEFQPIYSLLRNGIIFVLFSIFLATGLFNLGYPIPIGKITPMIIGILFLLLGNYMGKIKQNYFIGIRTPWTLASNTVWNKTHRIAGFLFVIAGIIGICVPFLNPTIAFPIFIGSILGMTFVVYAYSYLLFRKEKTV